MAAIVEAAPAGAAKKVKKTVAVEPPKFGRVRSNLKVCFSFQNRDRYQP